MVIDASVVVSILSAVIALLSWLEARRMSQLTKLAFRHQSYEMVTTLPSVEVLGIIEVGTKKRAKLVVFNQRETPYRINCVKCYSYAPKPRNLTNWFRSKLEPFDWDYSHERAFWNPKGTLDDEEHYAEETLPFTLVKDREILLVTLNDFRPFKKYRFDVVTSQGTTSWEGELSNEKTSLPYEHVRTII